MTVVDPSSAFHGKTGSVDAVEWRSGSDDGEGRTVVHVLFDGQRPPLACRPDQLAKEAPPAAASEPPGTAIVPFDDYEPWAVGMYRVGVHYQAVNRSLGRAVIRFKRWTELTPGGLATFDVVDADVWHDPKVDPALQPDPSFDGARQTLSLTWRSFDEDWRVISRVGSQPALTAENLELYDLDLEPGDIRRFYEAERKLFFDVEIVKATRSKVTYRVTGGNPAEYVKPRNQFEREMQEACNRETGAASATDEE